MGWLLKTWLEIPVVVLALKNRVGNKTSHAAFAWSSGAEEDAGECAGLAGLVPARWL